MTKPVFWPGIKDGSPREAEASLDHSMQCRRCGAWMFTASGRHDYAHQSVNWRERHQLQSGRDDGRMRVVMSCAKCGHRVSKAWGTAALPRPQNERDLGYVIARLVGMPESDMTPEIPQGAFLTGSGE